MKLYKLYDRNFEANGPGEKLMAEAFESSDGRLTVHWVGDIQSVQTYIKKEDWFKVAITFGGRWIKTNCENTVNENGYEEKINLHYFNQRQHVK